MTHMSLILRWTHRIVASSPQISRSSTPITSSNEFDGDVFWEIMTFDEDVGRSGADIVVPIIAVLWPIIYLWVKAVNARSGSVIASHAAVFAEPACDKH